MATRPFIDVPIPVDNKTATTILQYKGIPNTVMPALPQLPAPNDTAFSLSYNQKLRSLNSPQFQASVPLKVAQPDLHDWARHEFARHVQEREVPPCLPEQHLFRDAPVRAPPSPLLGHERRIHHRFPRLAPNSVQLHRRASHCQPQDLDLAGHQVGKIAFNSTVKLSPQDANLLTAGSHPFHLHGYNFVVVGQVSGTSTRPRTPPSTTWSTRWSRTWWESRLAVGPPFDSEPTI
ncbi:PPM-type phosphatase domain-containing protein [Psidium guajava]|nr:PPM-type phosphatase domain-containing protein [Psidium guajava]